MVVQDEPGHAGILCHDAPVDPQDVLEALLAETGASRVTLRQRTPRDAEAGFPVTHEALGAAAPSIRGIATPSMARQPVVLRVLAGEQVVQDDCEACFPGDEPFHAMLELYGGMRAQIVTPLVRDGATVAILSLHELSGPRRWHASDAAACSRAATSLLGLIGPDAE
jgi:GAF domain-containing protein